jgi:hypothetical protein
MSNDCSDALASLRYLLCTISDGVHRLDVSELLEFAAYFIVVDGLARDRVSESNL